MRHLGQIPLILGGLLLAAAACTRDTVAPRVSLPYIEIPDDEPVTMPVRITARETPPPEAG